VNFIPTEHDIRVARLLDKELGPIRFIEVIHHEENRMTDVMPEQEQDYDGEPDGPGPYRGATYPEYPYSLADHVYTWSPKLPDGSMLVIRSQSADGLVKAVKEMGPLAGQLRAAWQDVVGQPQAPTQGGLPQQTAATPPPFGPNVSAPQAPGYQGPPAQAQQWTPPQAQAAPAWGGGGGQQGGGNKPQPKQCPPGWYRTDKNSGPGADFWKNWREQNQGALKGKISWGGASTFWVAPDVAQMVNAAGFVVVAA
jgi:hypothetical protein